MPFKSSAQQRKCFALKAKGKNGSWNCDEFSKNTDYSELPEKVSKKKKKKYKKNYRK